MHKENKAEKHLDTNPFNFATKHRRHRGRNTPARLRPLAAVLVLALNGGGMSTLPTLGATTAGTLFLVAPRDAHAACNPSTPAITAAGITHGYACMFDGSGTPRGIGSVN